MQQDCPPVTGDVEYRIQVDSEFAGSATRSQVVSVVEAQPTPVPEQSPQITSFQADPSQIGLDNTCTTLTWSCTGTSIAGISLSRTDQNGSVVVLSEGDTSSPFQDCVNLSLAGRNADHPDGQLGVRRLRQPRSGGGLRRRIALASLTLGNPGRMDVVAAG